LVGSGAMCSVECQNQARPLQTLPTSGGILSVVVSISRLSVASLCYVSCLIGEMSIAVGKGSNFPVRS